MFLVTITGQYFLQDQEIKPGKFLVDTYPYCAKFVVCHGSVNKGPH